MPLIPGLRVVRSSTHGYGVVALRDFAEGDLLADVEGVAWREGEWLSLIHISEPTRPY